MASSWMLLLAVLGGACALPAPEPFAYTQALAQAVNSYNQRPEVKNAFRLLSAEPQPEPGVELSSLQAFSFSMMETECAASARSDPEDWEGPSPCPTTPQSDTPMSPEEGGGSWGALRCWVGCASSGVLQGLGAESQERVLGFGCGVQGPRWGVLGEVWVWEHG
uniref:CTHL1 protein n=1 Tax=Catharus ustulatus TaxID=91951 RepID=A0A8C3TW46_CATUS